MKVTVELLREWGATCNLDWFEKRYPDGVEGTAEELAAVPDHEYDQWWILVEMAVRLTDRDGADALRLATERVDPSRLAALAIRVKDKDTGEAMTKLCASKDLMSLKRVVDKGATEDAAAAQAVLDAELAAKEAV